jgi:hypothetical protein
MGRLPIGKTAMTDAERQRRHREKQKPPARPTIELWLEQAERAKRALTVMAWVAQRRGLDAAPLAELSDKFQGIKAELYERMAGSVTSSEWRTRPMSYRKITKISELKRYLREMIKTGRPGRDTYHAGMVDKVVLSAVGHLVLFADDDSIEIAERTKNGNTYGVNLIWFTVAGKQYAIVYSSTNKRIEIRDRTRQGPIMGHFDNATTSAQIMNLFDQL